MRNLKKFLALVLALMMVVSVMVTVSAAELSDMDEVADQYAASAEVLTTLDVYRGKGDGTYAPKADITRAEFATILYRVITGDVMGEKPILKAMGDVDLYTDMAGFEWAAPYVNYVSSEGVMIGVGDGKFNPGGNITGFEVLVAMLRAVGYDANQEITNSSNWRLTAAREASLQGITDGTEPLMSNNATREVVGQLVLNTMVNTPQVVWSVTSNPACYQPKAGDADLTLGKEFFNGLKKSENAGEDDYGRPTTAYEDANGKTIAEAADTKPVATYNGDFDEAAAKKLGADGKTMPAENDVTVIYNGGGDNVDLQFKKDDTSGVMTTAGKAINGYEIEVYDVTEDDDTAPQYILVVREAYLARVGKADAEAKTVELYVYEAGKVSKSDDQTGVKISVTDKSDCYADLTAHAEGDYVAVYAKSGWDKNNTIFEVAELEKQSVTISRVNRDSTGFMMACSVVIDGTTYKFTNQSMLMKNNNDATEATYALPSVGEATVYLYNGNILMTDQTEEKDDTLPLAIVMDARTVAASTGNWSSEGQTNQKFYAKLYLVPTAETVEVEVSADANATGTSLLGKLVTYSVNNNDQYVLSVPDGAEQTAAEDNAITTTGNAMGTVNGTNYAYDNKTVFIVIETKEDGDDESKITVTVKNTYVGIDAVPTIKGTATTKVTPVSVDAAGTGVAATVANKVANYVLINNPAGETGEIKDTYYIVGNASATKITEVGADSKPYSYYNFQAVVNGEIVTVKVDAASSDSNVQALWAGTNKFVQSVTTTKNGAITTLGTAATATSISSISKAANGIITINGETSFAVTDSLTVYIYDANGAIAKASVSDIASSENASGSYVKDATTGALTTIYLAKAAE